VTLRFLLLLAVAVLPAAPGRATDYAAIEARVVAVAQGKPEFGSVRGTAFLVGPRGLLATAAHVVTDPDGLPLENLFVLRPTPPNITASPAKVVRVFPGGRDLALLQVARQPGDPDLPFFEIGENAATGEDILMAGYPLVFDRVYRWPLFRFGRISSTRYFLRQSKVLVLDMVSADGFSGAPVVRVSDGRVIGVQKGGATGNAHAGFSVATEISPVDLTAENGNNAGR
jgi:hypothetical protein